MSQITALLIFQRKKEFFIGTVKMKYEEQLG